MKRRGKGKMGGDAAWHREYDRRLKLAKKHNLHGSYRDDYVTGFASLREAKLKLYTPGFK
jgi:hypothetical protein